MSDLSVHITKYLANGCWTKRDPTQTEVNYCFISGVSLWMITRLDNIS